MLFYYFAAALTAVSLVRSQTETVVDANGNTIVELITENAAGIPTTTILSTITPGVAAQQPVQQGPVGAPAPTPEVAGLPTPFSYTTTDANGNVVVLSATFTPSFVSIDTPPTPTVTGTILDISAFLSLVGTNTVPASAASAVRWNFQSKALSVVAGLLIGLFGGVYLVVA